MRNELKFASVALLGFLAIGCGKSDNAAAPANQPAGSSSGSNAASDAANAAKNAVGNATSTVQGATASAEDAAKAKMKTVEDYIANNKLDAADSALKEVEGVKSSLPDSVQQDITSLRQKLDAAKAMAGGGPKHAGFAEFARLIDLERLDDKMMVMRMQSQIGRIIIPRNHG